MTAIAKVKLLIFSIDNGYKELVEAPEDFVYEDETFIQARDKLSKSVVDLSPEWIKYSLLDIVVADIELEDKIACAIYGGLIPFNTPINTKYQWVDTKSNYLSKVMSAYA